MSGIVGWIAALLAGALALVLACSGPRAGAGAEVRIALDSGTRERGEALLARLRCTACHAASEAVLARVEPEAAPDLAAIGARKTPAALREWLLDPRSLR